MVKVVYIPANKTNAPPAARFFIEDLIKVCKKHGYGLSYEGTRISGDFVIEAYHPSFAERMRVASVHLIEEVNDG